MSEDQILFISTLTLASTFFVLVDFINSLLARIIHDGSSSPTQPSPILWGRVREGGRDGRAEPGGGVTLRLGVPKGVCPLRGDSTRGPAPL